MLTGINSISLELQRDNCTVFLAEELFKGLLNDYSTLETHVSADE